MGLQIGLYFATNTKHCQDHLASMELLTRIRACSGYSNVFKSLRFAVLVTTNGTSVVVVDEFLSLACCLNRRPCNTMTSLKTWLPLLKPVIKDLDQSLFRSCTLLSWNLAYGLRIFFCYGISVSTHFILQF